LDVLMLGQKKYHSVTFCSPFIFFLKSTNILSL
jgi:hypothetical protein